MGHIGNKFSEAVFLEESVQNLLHSGETFDMVIVEQFFNEAHKGFANHLNASLVVLSTIGASIWTNHLVGNPNTLSYMSDFLLGYSSHMSFSERITNTIFVLFETIYFNLFFFKQQNNMLQKYIPNSPNIYEVMRNTSLILLNSHVSYSPIKPHVPNMVEVGGFHIKESEGLPQDLKQFLDESKEGAVFFSLGSNLQSKDIPTYKLEQILNAFRKLKVNILWKFEDENLANMPKNLKIGKWFPQQSILGKNLFITFRIKRHYL